MSNTRILYVGLDVDKEKIATAVMQGSGEELVGARIIRNNAEATRKYFQELAAHGTKIRACYEAGFCGFQLARQLSGMGIECAVAAPGMLPSTPSDRV